VDKGVRMSPHRGSPALNRRELMSAALAGSVALAGAGTVLGQARPAAAADADFDFDTGNAVKDVISVAGGLTIAIDPMDATILIRLTSMMAVAWFDAIAPYHSTAVGIHSDLGRRPAGESATNRTRNIALFYASYRVLRTFSMLADAAREMMTDIGLDPDDTTENTTSAVGIGNMAGNSVVRAKMPDGLNQLGDEGGRKYNLQPFADYTGYQPVNTAYELRHPSRWQPNVLAKGTTGVYEVQQFVTPQMARTTPYTFADPKAFLLPPPDGSSYEKNPRAYRRQADEILAASANLTDEQKMAVQLFADKTVLGSSTAVTAENAKLGFDAYFHYFATVNIAAYDAGIAAWYNKVHYDSVRPFSAIRLLYGDKKVRAWGGPGKGTVDDLPGRDWRSFVNTPDHAEYPSGSTFLCSAHAQSARRFLGTDEISYTRSYAKGSSVLEPGVTPARDLVLSWKSWTDFNHDCGMSRLWGGPHFLSSIEAAWKTAPQFGDLAYEFVQRHVKGQAGVARS